MYKKNEVFSERQKLMMPFGIMRAIIFVILFAIYVIVTKILVLICDPKELINDRYYNLFTMCIVRMTLFCLGVVNVNIHDENGENFAGSLRVSENENKEHQFRTIIANHTGAMDIFVMTYLLGSHANISTYELAELPIFGGIIKLWGGAFVNRADKKSKESVKKYIRDNVEKYPWLIYPERGDNRGKELLPFQSVAFSLDKKITPIIIDYGEQTIELAGGFPQKRHPYYLPRSEYNEEITEDGSIPVNFIKGFLTYPYDVNVTVFNDTDENSEVIRQHMAKTCNLTALPIHENFNSSADL